MLSSQVTAAELSYEIEQPQMVAMQVHQGASTRFPSHSGTPQERSYHSEHSCGYQALKQLQTQAGSNTQMPVQLTPHNRHVQLHPLPFHMPSQPTLPRQTYPQQSFPVVQLQTHHHHRLPNQGPRAKPRRTGEPPRETDQYGSPNMVGQAGMPATAPEPKDSKHKLTIEDDALLVELKKTKNLTWKQISNFFPGRSPGTLRVRYCTKLKAKTIVWTDDTVGDDTAASAAKTYPIDDVRPLAYCFLIKRLRTAVDEYEADRWRIISDKVGNGFSAAACRDKAKSLVQPDVTAPSAKANRATGTCKQVGGRSSGNRRHTSRSQKNTTCILEARSDVSEAHCS
ncbi:hypothetical protein LTR17_018479 [Elasticomyces elasticus]|nr:hypothetical protein LTR17_018479 [Elasticomyces elasticus]